MDAQHGGGAALVAVAVLQHFDEQRDFQFAQRDLVEVVGAAAIEVAEVTPYRIRDVLAQRRARRVASGVVCAFGAFGVQGLRPLRTFTPPGAGGESV